MKNKKLINSFKYAFNGIKLSLKNERNMKIHFSIMILVIIGGLLFKLNTFEWLECISCFACVIGSEMFNTAIENLVDLKTKEKNEIAKIVKDISAGAVLIFAIRSIIVGFIIFIPKIINLL